MSRVQIEITLGIILVVLTSALLIYVGLNENTRMELFEREQRARAIEVGADLYDINCTGCHGPQGQGIPGLAPPLNDRHFFDGRLAEVGWTGSQEDYIVSTIATGRLVSTRPDQFVGGGKPAMPPWSEHYGGPLRADQIDTLATFIMNWEPTAGEVTTSTVPAGQTVGTDINVELPEGNPANGEALANSQGCVACHVTTPTGPAWTATADEPAMGARAEARYQSADYTGNATSADQYLVEAIIDPHIYLVEGYGPIMPNDYGTKLTAQDLADLIAYMKSIP